MKPYFVKHLPLLGNTKRMLFLCSIDINIGDKVVQKLNTGRWPVDVGTVSKFNENGFPFIAEMPYEFKSINSKSNVGKVIGEISPGALWVKDKDELCSDDIDEGFFYHLNKDNITNDRQWIRWNDDKSLLAYKENNMPLVIRIKCPTCQTFH